MGHEKEYADRRGQMVESFVARGITDGKVLRAMGKVPRHRFIPSEQRPQAYNDHPLQIGHGQTISQPYMVAYMTEALGPLEGKRVLEVGTGCGYQTAVLCEMGARVYTVEIVDALANAATARLSTLGYKVTHRIGNGREGWPAHAPFDRILCAAAPAELPGALVEQLAEGGRMVIPTGSWMQELHVLEKRGGELIELATMGVRFVPLVE